MSIIFSLLGGVRGMIYIAIILAIGTWAGVQYKKLSSAETARDQAIVQRDQAAIARDKAIQAARDNEQTIARLEQEKLDLNASLNKLAAQKQEIRTVTNTRQIYIDRQVAANVPEDTAKAAPVLNGIITEVQADRKRRRGVAP